MYLSELNATEGKKFLELVYKIANSDVNYAGEEIHLIKKFKKELDIEVIPSGSTIDELINYFAAAPVSVQKIVLFEAAGMVTADKNTTAKEQEILDKMAAAFGLSAEQKDMIVKASAQLEAAYEAANAAVR